MWKLKKSFIFIIFFKNKIINRVKIIYNFILKF